MQPLIKWAGGKRWILPTLEPLIEDISPRRIVEPFCGALGLSLGLEARHVLANDINPSLIGLYRGIKRGETFDLKMTLAKTRYAKYRKRFNRLYKTEPRSWECSQLFYYLLKSCFNGLCRFNGRGEFNVSLGSYSQVNYEVDVDQYQNLFANWSFKCGDFTRLDIKSGDFVFVDPPYDDTFSSYSEHKFDWNDQQRVADWSARLGQPTVVTNNATSRICRLYTDLGFEVRYIDAPRRIARNGNRDAAREMIAFKNCEPIGGLKKCRMIPRNGIQ